MFLALRQSDEAESCTVGCTLIPQCLAICSVFKKKEKKKFETDGSRGEGTGFRERVPSGHCGEAVPKKAPGARAKFLPLLNHDRAPPTSQVEPEHTCTRIPFVKKQVLPQRNSRIRTNIVVRSTGLRSDIWRVMKTLRKTLISSLLGEENCVPFTLW